MLTSSWANPYRTRSPKTFSRHAAPAGHVLLKMTLVLSVDLGSYDHDTIGVPPDVALSSCSARPRSRCESRGRRGRSSEADPDHGNVAEVLNRARHPRPPCLGRLSTCLSLAWRKRTRLNKRFSNLCRLESLTLMSATALSTRLSLTTSCPTLRRRLSCSGSTDSLRFKDRQVAHLRRQAHARRALASLCLPRGWCSV